MHAPVLSIFAALFLSFSLLLLAFAPYAEGLAGRSSVSGALGSALLFLLLTLVFGLYSTTLMGHLSASAACLILVLMLLSYILFRVRNNNAKTDKTNTTTPGSGANCRSRLTSGTGIVAGPDLKTWRTYLYTVYSTSPSHGALVEFAKAWGGAYYGIYFTTGTVKVTPTVTVVCEDNDGNTCLADASETGDTGLPDPPVRVKVVNAITSSASRVRVTVVMGAALSASGGPSIAIAPGGIGPTLSFPDASLTATTAMGTYRWRCEPGETLTG